MKKKWILAAVIVVAIILSIGLNIWSQPVSNAKKLVKTASLQKEQIEETVIVPGKLKFSDEQTIYFQEDRGEVDEILVEEGVKVKKGDKILSYKNEILEDKQMQNNLQINLHYLELENIKNKHKKIDKELENDKDNEEIQSQHDDIELQEKQKNLELKQAQLEQESINREIADTTIESDIDGTIVSINDQASFGANLSDPQPIMQIGSLDSMQVNGEISEYDTLKIKEGQSVQLTSDAMPDSSWKGQVHVISNLPEQLEDDDSGARYSVEVKLEDEKIPLKPGFDMLMKIEVNRKKVNSLPLTAVVQDANTDFVLVVEDGLAKRKKVTTGIATNKVIEIKDGVGNHAKVIINPGGITDGEEVDIE